MAVLHRLVIVSELALNTAASVRLACLPGMCHEADVDLFGHDFAYEDQMGRHSVHAKQMRYRDLCERGLDDTIRCENKGDFLKYD